MFTEEKFPRDFGDNYKLLDVLGIGGMGKVYLSVCKKLKRRSAIKIIRSDILDMADDEKSKKIVQRFDSEVKTTAKLSHKSIASVYDAGYLDGQFFYSMQYINGDSLSELIENGPISDERAAKIVMQVAMGIQHAHQNGILHRDIKPGNVMIDTEHKSYIMDFGVAKELKKTTQTEAGELFGTISYMSPEQAQNSTRLDERSDIYSLGAILYFALSGKPPLVASNELQTLAYLATLEPVELKKINSSVRNDLNSICMKCLEKNPTARYQSAENLAEDLDRFLKGEPVLAKPIPISRKVTRWAIKEKRRLVMTLTLLLIFGTLFFINARFNQAAKVNSLVESLQTADPVEIPRIIRELRCDPTASKPLLNKKLQSTNDENIQLRLSLPFGAHQIQPSEIIHSNNFDRLFEIFVASVQELPSVSQGEIDRLWAIALTKGAPRLSQLRAASFLSNIDATNKKRWSKFSESLADHILEFDVIEADQYLKRISKVLPELANRFRQAFLDKNSSERASIAAIALSMIYEDNPNELVTLAVKSAPIPFSFLFSKIEKHKTKTVPLLIRITKKPVPNIQRFGPDQRLEIDTTAPGYDPMKGFSITHFPEDAIRMEKAIAFLTLIRLGEIHWEDCFAMTDDPVIQSVILHNFAVYRCPINPLVNALESDSIRLNPNADLIILAIGSNPEELATQSIKDACTERVSKLYAKDTRSGVHSAAEWFLKKFNRLPLKEKGTQNERAFLDAVKRKRDWYRTSSGLTMAVVRKNFDISIPVSWHKPTYPRKNESLTYPERPHVNDFHTYAMSTKEITKKQFDEFQEHQYHNKGFGKEPNCPVNNLSYQTAAKYCNWLTVRDGYSKSELCYVEENGLMKLVNNYHHRKGYRLPTVFEWDNATNQDFRILHSNLCYSNYIWASENSNGDSKPVGLLKPNRQGLFDMHGNAREVCSRNGNGKEKICVMRGVCAGVSIHYSRTLSHSAFSTKMTLYYTGIRVVQSMDSKN